MSNNHSLRSILDANKLTGPNFLDWYRNLRIVLKQEKRLYVLEHAKPGIPPVDAPEEVLSEFIHHTDDDEQATCVMLASMSPELQRQHENMDSQTIILHLKELFDSKCRNERYEVSRELFRCKMTEGSSVNVHVLKMIGYIEKLGQLGFVMDHELSIDLVLQSLPPSFSQFIMNFNMNQLETTLPGLLGMLTTAEGELKKNKSLVLMVQSSKTK
ncbi:uncharacterized protein LOC131175879 [Hevea brasiliensis]|uniref:uncharacterized protein LOC131175879 n=1 Tax=Hevea brasiliensis TaxID=3981 RepID=UPI0025D698F1|nr:uncharacterized protein LOC131175879 [Hevea brasiliensis]